MRKYLSTGAVVLCGMLAGFALQPLISGDNVFDNIRKFDRVLNTAMKNYVTDVDPDKMTEAAIRGMLNELDPHSVYITAEEMKAVNEDFSGSFEGIGVEFDIVNDTLTVVAPINGGPSEAVGVQSGDKIIKIDNQNAVGISRNDVPKKLKGAKGTTVVLDIKRNNNKDLLNFSIVRDKIPINSVVSKYIIEGTDIGFIAVNRFMATTNDELTQAMEELQKQGMKKLLLDLRYNPGGYLEQAYRMADEFLGQGDTIVYTIGRKPEFNESYVAKGGDKWENIPIIVMVNAGSASASEIVSGAIQDQDRGLVVGETSFGKGLVQRAYNLGDGSSFRLTISKYFTPSGRCIQRKYEDKNDYRHLVGRLDLEDGVYINDALTKIKDQVHKFNDKAKNDKEKIQIDSLPLYKTKRGRTVFGAGGITPDVIIKQDTLTKLGVELRSKDLFYQYVEDYLNKNGKEVKEKYQNNFLSFLKNFEINNAMLSDFKKLAISKGITWDEELAKTDKDFFQISIKATIARSIWDRNKSNQVFSYMDKQVSEAIKYFPDAMKLAKNK